MRRPTAKLAKHKKGSQAAIKVISEHWMELPPDPPKKPAKPRRVLKGRP